MRRVALCVGVVRGCAASSHACAHLACLETCCCLSLSATQEMAKQASITAFFGDGSKSSKTKANKRDDVEEQESRHSVSMNQQPSRLVSLQEHVERLHPKKK